MVIGDLLWISNMAMKNIWDKEDFARPFLSSRDFEREYMTSFATPELDERLDNKRLSVQFLIEQTYDGARQFEHAMERGKDGLAQMIMETMPVCSECDHRALQVDKNEDMRTLQTRIRLSAICKERPKMGYPAVSCSKRFAANPYAEVDLSVYTSAHAATRKVSPDVPQTNADAW